MPENPVPNWRGKNASGPVPPNQKAGGWRNEKVAGPSGTGRKAKLIVLGFACVAAVAGVVTLIFYLMRPPEPTLLIVAADPLPAAERLNVPPDIYGWLGGKALAAWTEQAQRSQSIPGVAPRLIANSGNPYRLADFDAAMKALESDSKADPVVIFLGAHGTLDDESQPSFYTGAVDTDGKATKIRLSKILDELNKDSLRKRKKLLILDPARLTPNPAIGEITPQFVRRVKQLEEKEKLITNCENLLVMIGSGEGERGWDSEALGQSVFFAKIRDGLTGEASKEKKSYSAWELFEYAQKQTEEWTRGRRPTPQKPILLPEETGRGKTMAQNMRLGVSIQKPEAEAATSLADLAKSLTRWKTCEELATAKDGPPPGAYSPRAWRRYRELCLRYALVVRAGPGMANVEAKLAGELDTLETAIRKSKDLQLDSARFTLAMKPALLPLDLSGKIIEDRLKAWGADTVGTPLPDVGGDKPTMAESHFARMMSFHRENKFKEYPPAKPTDPPSVQALAQLANTTVTDKAIRVRLLAERAAFGIAMPEPPRAAYTERVWPSIEAKITAADAARRLGEDLVFGPPELSDVYAKAVKALDDAQQGYEEAQKGTANILRNAWETRDDALADLPYLGVWVAEAMPAKVDELKTLWGKVHELTTLLESPTPDVKKLDGLIKDVKENVEQLRRMFAASAETTKNAPLPREWDAVEKLLLVPVPMVSVLERGRLETLARDVVYALDTKPDSGSEKSTALIDSEAKKRVRDRALLAACASNNEDLKRDINKMLDSPDWTTDAITVARGIGKTYRTLEENAHYPKSATNPDVALDKAVADRWSAEAASRLALPFAPAEAADKEPAEDNRKWRWRAVLLGMAQRAALDHWYDENQLPFSHNAARGYLADAQRLTGETQDPRPFVTPPATASLLALEKWTITPVGVEKLMWTSEPARQVRFVVDRKGWRSEDGGRAGFQQTLDAKTTEPPLLIAISPNAARQMGTLGADVTELPTMPMAVVKPDEVGSGTAMVNAGIFFRGQRPEAKLPILLNRKPDWVVANVKSQAKDGAMLAITSDDVALGAVAIVVDFSASMSAKTGNSTRLELALKTLKRVIDSFPDDNPSGFPVVSIRAFGHKLKTPGKKGGDDYDSIQAHTADTAIERLFPRESETVPDTMTREKIVQLKRVVDDLFRMENKGATPLVSAIEQAIAEDFPANYTGPKTVLVLTDGMDSSFGLIEAQDKKTEGQKTEIIQKVRDRFDSFRTRGVAIHMVFFQAGSEISYARRQFCTVSAGTLEKVKRDSEPRLDEKPFTTPGNIWEASDEGELLKQLTIALRPKPRLMKESGDPAEGVPRFGLPTNFRKDPDISLRWYGRDNGTTGIEPTPGDYELRLTGTEKQQVSFVAGDRMLIDMKKGPTGIVFSRVPYLSAYHNAPNRFSVSKEQDWQMAVLQNAIQFPNNRQTLLMMTGAESLMGLSPGKDGVIKNPAPAFTWWEVAAKPGDPFTPFSGGRVDNITNYPHAAWQVKVDAWPNQPDNPNAVVPPRLRAWVVPKEAPLAETVELTLNPKGEVNNEKDKKPFKVRMTLEPVKLRTEGDLETFETKMCVVLRLDHPAGREVFPQLFLKRTGGGPVVLSYDEVRFYRTANACTAFFGPISEADAQAALDATVKLISITDVKAGAGRPFTFEQLQAPGQQERRPKPPQYQKELDQPGGNQ